MRTTLAAWLAVFSVALIAFHGGRAAEPRSVATAGPSARDANAKIANAAESTSEAATKFETAVFAGGCFWCTELAFEQLRGVMEVESGYCGGTRATATYDRVHRGTTAHAEAVRVTYDPTKIRFDQLLDVFFDMHDPTQFKRQGDDDVGRQYRSAIFFADEEQKKEAETKINELRRKRVYTRHIVTRLEPLTTFYPAEEIHQNFARKFPLEPYIQDHAIPRACNVRMMHPELIGPGR